MNKVFIERNSFQIRRTCATCGGCTDKTCAHPKLENDDGSTVFLCDECLQSGETGIRERLARRAKELEEWAAELRQAASEQWEMPSMLQLQWYRAKASRPDWPDDLANRLYKNDVIISESDVAVAENEQAEAWARYEAQPENKLDSADDAISF